MSTGIWDKWDNKFWSALEKSSWSSLEKEALCAWCWKHLIVPVKRGGGSITIRGWFSANGTVKGNMNGGMYWEILEENWSYWPRHWIWGEDGCFNLNHIYFGKLLGELKMIRGMGHNVEPQWTKMLICDLWIHFSHPFNFFFLQTCLCLYFWIQYILLVYFH